MLTEQNSKPDFRQHAKDLAETAISLITHIVEKHDATILEVMHEEIKKRDAEIKKLKTAIEKLTTWSYETLGEDAVKDILDGINCED
jgi:hypothetical protein